MLAEVSSEAMNFCIIEYDRGQSAVAGSLAMSYRSYHAAEKQQDKMTVTTILVVKVSRFTHVFTMTFDMISGCHP